MKEKNNHKKIYCVSTHKIDISYQSIIEKNTQPYSN